MDVDLPNLDLPNLDLDYASANHTLPNPEVGGSAHAPDELLPDVEQVVCRSMHALDELPTLPELPEHVHVLQPMAECEEVGLVSSHM